MRDVKKIERKLCLTNSAAAKICSIANKKGEEKNKIFAAKQMLVYYLGDILVILRKDSYTPDDILLLILKTSMCLNAIRYLFQATLEKDCLNYLNDEEKKVIARFRTLRSITTAHPFDTSRGAPSDFGRNGTEWFVDIHPFCKMDTFMIGGSCGFCDDEAYDDKKKPDFVMMVCSETNDFPHRRAVYIYDDVINPLEITFGLLKRGLKGRLK